jgi:hypothetical protein
MGTTVNTKQLAAILTELYDGSIGVDYVRDHARRGIIPYEDVGHQAWVYDLDVALKAWEDHQLTLAEKIKARRAKL